MRYFDAQIYRQLLLSYFCENKDNKYIRLGLVSTKSYLPKRKRKKGFFSGVV